MISVERFQVNSALREASPPLALKTTRILRLFRESLAVGLFATPVLGNCVNLLLGRIAPSSAISRATA
jgi:hypothetical protein